MLGRSTAVTREEPVSEPKPDGKPFVISKRLVWEAWLRRGRSSRVGLASESGCSMRCRRTVPGPGGGSTLQPSRTHTTRAGAGERRLSGWPGRWPAASVVTCLFGTRASRAALLRVVLGDTRSLFLKPRQSGLRATPCCVPMGPCGVGSVGPASVWALAGTREGFVGVLRFQCSGGTWLSWACVMAVAASRMCWSRTSRMAVSSPSAIASRMTLWRS